MPCPICKGKHIVLAGKYKIKRTNVPRKRLKCQDCKHYFIIRNETYRIKIQLSTRKEIIRLYSQKKQHVNKFDSLKKNTYSTREIASMLKVSKSFVHKVIHEIL